MTNEEIERRISIGISVSLYKIHKDLRSLASEYTEGDNVFSVSMGNAISFVSDAAAREVNRLQEERDGKL